MTPRSARTGGARVSPSTPTASCSPVASVRVSIAAPVAGPATGTSVGTFTPAWRNGDGLAKAPYIREPRRIRAKRTIVGSLAVRGEHGAVPYRDSVSINGCYRLHPVEWNVGEVAAALAAHCLEYDLEPHQVHATGHLLDAFRDELIRDGLELAWPQIKGY